MEKILRLVRELDAVLSEGNVIDQLVAVNALNSLMRKYSPNANRSRTHRNTPRINEHMAPGVSRPFDHDR